jgi:predicted helicase
MSLFPLKSKSTYVKAYYAALDQFHRHRHTTEGNTRSAFADLLKKCASPYDWHLVEEYQFKGTNKQPLRADGALVDELTLVHGLWEAKDTADDLQTEIKKKVAAGYPLTNILFQSPDRAVLYQDNRIALDCDITKPESLIEVLQLFFDHRQPHEVDWEEAVLKFSEKIPDLAAGVTKILEAEHKKNADFREKFQAFADLCRQSINPDLTDPAIQKMLVQHLLTERIFRKVFDNQEFLSRNIIAAEIEKVIHSITAKHFSRDTFLKPLDRFYKAIEEAALTQTGYTEKQHFLNAVYEKFFQSFDKKQSDTHGIVYTPQPIVDFMVRSVEEILKSEFGKSLSDEGVHILDPFTGTGNFITRMMQQIKKSRLPQKYASELHCNEIMLLPYYIASMNIEHAYMERTNEYKPFEGICLVDTFELAEAEQQGFSFMVEENTKRVRKQRNSPITVIIGNPPYNANQHYENENNKNRKYKVISERVAKTYAKDSAATNKNMLSDPYVGAFRWASDRLGDEGVIALVTNNSFVDAIAGDGIRKHLRQDFNEVFVIDLGGDVRRNPKLSGTVNNVFGIQVGVSISLFVRRQGVPRKGSVYLKRVDEYWKSAEKLAWLEHIEVLSKADTSEVPSDPSGRWIAEQTDFEYSTLAPFSTQGKIPGLFDVYSNGVQSNRDPWVFNFDRTELLKNVSTLIETYNAERLRWHKLTAQKQRDSPVIRDDKKIKWCSKLQQLFDANTAIDLNTEAVEEAQYRPFTTQLLYDDKPLLHRAGQVASFTVLRTKPSS